MIDPAELLLAVTGLSPFIDGKPPRITIAVLQKARDLPQQIVDKATRTVHGALDHTPIPRPHSYTQLLDRMTRPLPAHELESCELTFAPEEHQLATPFTILVQHVYSQLQSIFPLSVVESYAGKKNVTPNDDKIFQFFNQFAVLNDPMRVFDLIGSGSLLRSQAAAMRAIYPTIAGAIDEAIQEATNEKRADAPEWTLPPRVEYGVSVWTGKRALDFKPPAPPAPGGPPPPPAKNGPNLQTPAQKAQQP